MQNVLCIHKDPEKYLNLVDKSFYLKDPPECPTMYLRVDISKFVITNNGNGVICWAMSANFYVNKALQVVEAKLKEENSM